MGLNIFEIIDGVANVAKAVEDTKEVVGAIKEIKHSIDESKKKQD